MILVSLCFQTYCVSIHQLSLSHELTLITEEATPALLTVTLPWLLTGSMQASWVTDALITVASLKPNSASVSTSKTFVRP